MYRSAESVKHERLLDVAARVSGSPDLDETSQVRAEAAHEA